MFACSLEFILQDSLITWLSARQERFLMFFALTVELLQMRPYYLRWDAAFRQLLKETIVLFFDPKIVECKPFEHFSFQLNGYY
jgi:hypothetical protein